MWSLSGYQRPLQATDLWKVDKSREAGLLSQKLDAAWDKRVREAAEWNARLDKGEIHPGLLRRSMWTISALAHGHGWRKRRDARQERWRTVDARKRASLAWALNEPFAFEFWSGGVHVV